MTDKKYAKMRAAQHRFHGLSWRPGMMWSQLNIKLKGLVDLFVSYSYEMTRAQDERDNMKYNALLRKRDRLLMKMNQLRLKHWYWEQLK